MSPPLELPPIFEVWTTGADALEQARYEDPEWTNWQHQALVYLRWLGQHAPVRIRCRPLVPLLIDGVCSIDGSKESTLPLTQLVLTLENDCGIKPGQSELARRLGRSVELALKYPPPVQPRATKPVASASPSAAVDQVPPPPAHRGQPQDRAPAAPERPAEGSTSAPPPATAPAPAPARQTRTRKNGKGARAAAPDLQVVG